MTASCGSPNRPVRSITDCSILLNFNTHSLSPPSSPSLVLIWINFNRTQWDWDTKGLILNGTETIGLLHWVPVELIHIETREGEEGGLRLCVLKFSNIKQSVMLLTGPFGLPTQTTESSYTDIICRPLAFEKEEITHSIRNSQHNKNFVETAAGWSWVLCERLSKILWKCG